MIMLSRSTGEEWVAAKRYSHGNGSRCFGRLAMLRATSYRRSALHGMPDDVVNESSLDSKIKLQVSRQIISDEC